MARDYAAEYARRIARGKAKGLSKTAARGHAKTPEHPERAYRASNEGKYREYIDRREDLVRRVLAKKQRIFGDSPKWVQRRAVRWTQERHPDTHRLPSDARMREFLRDDFNVASLDWSNASVRDDFAFLFYH